MNKKRQREIAYLKLNRTGLAYSMSFKLPTHKVWRTIS